MSDSGSGYRRSRRAGVWLWVVFVAIGLAAAYWLVSKNGIGAGNAGSPARSRAMATPAVPVKIEAARIGRINLTLRAIGTVTAFNTVTVRSRVDGELQKILFKDGQKVKKGDLLAQIDPRTYQVALEQALGQQQQNVAQLKNAQRDLQRYQLLYTQKSIARQQVDAQQALVQQLLGSQKSDQAAVDSARLQLDFTRITAPITGRLGLRKVDQGNLISASNVDGLVVITQTQPISVMFSLPQSQLPDVLAQLRAGNKLAVDLYSRDDVLKIGTGELASVDNQIDVATGTLKLEAHFANEDEALFPNQFVNVRLHVSAIDDALVVPTIAVQQGSVGAFVYVIDADNKAHIRRVETATIDGGLIAVKSGLTAGQRVVIEGVDRLREGATVEIVSADAVAAANRGGALRAPGAGRSQSSGGASPAAHPH